jgi:hypothetical protein
VDQWRDWIEARAIEHLAVGWNGVDELLANRKYDLELISNIKPGLVPELLPQPSDYERERRQKRADEWRQTFKRMLHDNLKTAESKNDAATSPGGTREAEGGTPVDKPDDGPFDADGFRFRGVEVRFGRAPKQYRLVKALWNAKANRPAEPRPIEDVKDEVWGEGNDTEDTAFRQLCSDTRKKLQTANCPLDIEALNGVALLVPL